MDGTVLLRVAVNCLEVETPARVKGVIQGCLENLVDLDIWTANPEGEKTSEVIQPSSLEATASAPMELPGSGAARHCCTSALLQPTETHTQVSDDVPTHTRPGLARGRPRQLGSRVLGTDSHLCAGRVPLFTTRTQAGSSASTVVGVTPPRVDRAGRPPHPEDAFPPRPWW